MDTTRVDVWLWAVRLYKSRSAATAACRGGHVRVNRAAAKASTPVKVGDRVEAFVERKRILEVVAIINKRVGARGRGDVPHRPQPAGSGGEAAATGRRPRARLGPPDET